MNSCLERAPSPRIDVRNLKKSYLVDGCRLPVLQGINIVVHHGELIAIIGPSGCGKSTLFNVISGLYEADCGEIFLDGEPCLNRIGLVSYMQQKDLLLPWRSVLDNAILGLELSGCDRADARRYALSLFQTFGLSGFERCSPSRLSGGMKRRVAFMRTFLCRNEVTLLDEPFHSLDPSTSDALQVWLLELWTHFQQTVLFITHNVEEAIFLSDRVYVMSRRPGTILAELCIPLPRPRTLEMKASSSFRSIVGELSSLIKKLHCF